MGANPFEAQIVFRLNRSGRQADSKIAKDVLGVPFCFAQVKLCVCAFGTITAVQGAKHNPSNFGIIVQCFRAGDKQGEIHPEMSQKIIENMIKSH